MLSLNLALLTLVLRAVFAQTAAAGDFVIAQMHLAPRGLAARPVVLDRLPFAVGHCFPAGFIHTALVSLGDGDGLLTENVW